MENKSPAFNSVIVLTITMLIVKILSAIYRVPYQNVLGDTGLYAYQQVYPIIAIVSVLSLNAIPSVISQSHYKSAFLEKLYKKMTWMSIIILMLIFIFSDLLAQFMGDAMLSTMLRISSLVLLPFPTVAMIRGKLQLNHEMKQIAYSQVIDQILRVSIILIAIALFVWLDLSVYESGAISVFGSFIGMNGACLYLIWSNKRSPVYYRGNNSGTYRNFVMLILFYSLSYLIMILWQLVDSFTVINQLKSIMPLNEARTLKGIYDRGGSLIQMGLIVTTSFSLVLIPLLSECIHNGQLKQMNSYANSALKITVVFSSAAAIGLMNLIKPFNMFLFKSVTGYEALFIYMLAIIFVSLIIMYTAMLQIFESYRIQLWGVVLGLAFKMILNSMLIPLFDIKGAALASVLGLLIYAIVLHIGVVRIYAIDFSSFLIKWIGTLLIMSGLLQCVNLIKFDSRLSALCVALLGVFLGVFVVVYAMIKLKIISRDEWLHLPFGNMMNKLMKE
ncbi:polysaccharide biosynthesis protein [Macrococcoides caseolyticum]|uniref:polysaccharide biosynthesis protein n=1 Tax=Macrococcoides caseolyticum TaxID=69966 RepID=UPI001F249096|nr:polysaccharide biosynthesis protein [Macrococcus caseolyticus]MCE4957949.1 polysaccharide biosynthesis protein [Macrococcus caseolyticus]